MVGELLRKLRKSEKQLKESESALDRLREQTVSMSRELAEPNRRGAGGLSLESVDFFGSRPLSRNGGRPAPNGRVKSANPEKAMRARDPRTVRPRAHAAALWRPGQCPSCGEKLLRAKSVNIITLVCLRCRGIFIDQRSLHQLAGTQNWFRSVERFLSASARVATGAPKSGRLSRARGR